MTGYVNFDLGIAIAIAASVYAQVDWWIRSRSHGKILRIFVSLVLFMPIALVVRIALGPKPLTIQMEAKEGNYEPSFEIGGILWTDSFSDLRVSATNPTDDSYTDVDIFVRTDLEIAQVGFLDIIKQCASAPTEMPFKMTLGIEDKTGKSFDVPVLPKLNMITITNIYRIHCDKLSPKSGFEAIIAIVSPNPRVNGHMPQTLLGPRKRPSWAVLQLEYTAGNRRLSKFEAKCFSAPCPNMPTEFSQVR